MTSKILIVDDDHANRDTLEIILSSEGYQLEMAKNGPEALTKARDLLPDVILLDVMMPGMSGLDVCRAIRNDPLVSEVPIILLTVLDSKNSKISGYEAGADAFITKPIDRTELLARLRGLTRIDRYRKLVEERTHLEQARLHLVAAYDAATRPFHSK